MNEMQQAHGAEDDGQIHPDMSAPADRFYPKRRLSVKGGRGQAEGDVQKAENGVRPFGKRRLFHGVPPLCVFLEGAAKKLGAWAEGPSPQDWD